VIIPRTSPFSRFGERSRNIEAFLLQCAFPAQQRLHGLRVISRSSGDAAGAIRARTESTRQRAAARPAPEL